MRSLRSLCTVLALSAAAVCLPLAAQTPANCAADGKVAMYNADKSLASPSRSAFTFLGKTNVVSVYYHAPSVHCRKIFGGLVPYGQVWRTGANPATLLVNQAPIVIGTLTVPAGVHTIYTLPAADGKWKLIVNNQVGQWGTVYDAAQDLGRTDLMVMPLKSSQETMSITFEKGMGGAGQDLHIKWADVDAMVSIKAAQ